MLKFKNNRLMFLLSLILATSLLFAGCWGDLDDGGSDSSTTVESSEEEGEGGEPLSDDELEELITKDYDNGIAFEEEAEGYEIKVEKEPPTQFVGKWEATSGNAHYLLGNLDLNIKADGTWKGNVAGDDVSGTWTEQDGGIYLKSSNPKVNFGGQLVFTPKGTLIYSYYPLENSTEPNTIVLTKK